MNKEFKINDLVEVPKWEHPTGKNWIIIGFASDGAEACICRCTDKDCQAIVLLSQLKHQEYIYFPALQTPEDQDQEAQRQDSVPEEVHFLDIVRAREADIITEDEMITKIGRYIKQLETKLEKEQLKCVEQGMKLMGFEQSLKEDDE